MNDRNVLNRSDHVPVSVTVQINEIQLISPQFPVSRPNWSKLSQQEIHEKYTEPIEEKIGTINAKYDINSIVSWHANLIDNVVADVVSSLIDTAASEIPKSVYRSYLKPYWSAELTQYRKK